jgi:hypothetical protein
MPRVKYNSTWSDDQDDLAIELACIAKGGKWINNNGLECGIGLLEHYLNARALIWPDRYRHRWTDLLYTEFLKNDITMMVGAASTQKTSHASEFVLISYWARPDKTLVVMSTITVEKLDTGVFAEVKMLWSAGKERWPWLSGNLLEHKRAIVTDNLEIKGMRDIRKGLVGKACFVSGTLIDTPTGKQPIESIRPGDFVINASGVGMVVGTHVREASTLYRIILKDGRKVDCTGEHPFMTQHGWVKARDITRHHRVLSPSEIQNLQTLPEAFFTEGSEERFLRQIVLREMEYVAPRNCETGVCEPGLESNRRKNTARHFERSGRTKTASRLFSTAGRKGAVRHNAPILDHPPKAKSLRISEKGSGECSDRSGVETVGTFPTGFYKPHYLREPEAKAWRVALVQSRFGVSEYQISHRGRWGMPFQTRKDEAGFEKGPRTRGTRVDSVKVLKRDDLAGHAKGQSGYLVYNLQVDGHPSYSVNDCLVHNCYTGGKWVGLGILAGTKQEYVYYLCDEIQFMAETFIGSWPNLFSNGNVKILGSGNPKHDPDDQLGIAAEPRDGWQSIGVPEKTTCWDTQFLNGRCVNLVGTDSPNFDGPADQPDRYPKLIGRKFVKRIIHDWGENSPEFYSQCRGVMRIDMADARVITRQICKEHHALDMPIWAGSSREWALGVDPSYGGGDACIGTFVAWSLDEHGKQIVSIEEQKEYRIDMSIDVSPEIQVAKQVKKDLEMRGMRPDQCAYDPYGKGTMGFAFSQVFGGDTPIPVDSGGPPTERPVREGLMIDESDGRKRPKTCREHYSKFVTEAWFSVRYLIEAEQLRKLPIDCMLEGCARKYETVAGNKIEVESKDDYKFRCKHSPNKFDSLAVAIERARQLGLVIDKLGSEEVRKKDSSKDYFEKEAQEYEELIAAGRLNHTGTARKASMNL